MGDNTYTINLSKYRDNDYLKLRPQLHIVVLIYDGKHYTKWRRKSFESNGSNKYSAGNVMNLEVPSNALW